MQLSILNAYLAIKFFYVVITADFATAMNGRQSTVNPGNFFSYAVTIDSVYVTNAGIITNFPAAFDSLAKTMPDSTLSVVALSQSDFPPPPPIGE